MVQTQMDDASGAQAGALLALLVVTPVALGVARWILRRHLARLMATASGAPAAPAEAPVAEVAPTAALRFLRFDVGTEVPAAAAKREELERRARARLRRAFVVEVGAAVGYLALLMGILGDMGVLLLSFNGGAYLVYLAFRYFRDRGQLRATDTRSAAARWAETAVAVLVGVLTLGRIRLRQSLAARAERQHQLRPLWQAAQILLPPAVATLVGVALALTGTPAGLLLVALAGLHVGALVRLRGWAEQAPGPGLLVLRVFDADESTRFTFGGLMAVWHHFGAFFTVVDSSFWRVQNRVDTWGFALGMVGLTAVGFFVSVMADTAGVLPAGVAAWTGVPVVVALVAAWTWAARRVMARQFVGSAEELAARLRRLDRHPLTLGLTYRALPAMCRDDTWRGTVQTLTERAGVVLMDLRGFSEARKGCAWEVGHLLDTKALERILFLLDRATDPEPVHRTIEASWHRLVETSPNLGHPSPVVRVYHAGAQDEADVEAILDALVGATGGVGRPEPNAVPS